MSALEDALASARLALVREPDGSRCHAQVGALLAALGRFDEAVEPLSRALELDPDQPEALNNLGAVRQAQGDLDGAITSYRRAVALAPDYADANRNLAGALRTSADAWAKRGNALVEDGRIAEAVPAFRAAIERGPDNALLYRLLAEADPSAITDEHVATLLALTSSGNGGTAEAHYALGRVYALRGDRLRSFAHFQVANRAARAKLEYDEAARLASFAEIAATFDAPYLKARRGTGCASPLPVFIVGMPRSGSTLIEQILASHPAVHATGEIPLFEEIVTRMIAEGAAPLREIGERYVSELAKLAPASALRVTDKMLSNFQYAGLIHLALPNARMIHARRDPLETCLSCFSNAFASDVLAWTCDLGEIGRYYRGYHQLMEHWRATLPPEAMLDVRYEDVVEDLEGQARRIVAYCGLPWDDRCLDFHTTQRAVKTASAVQVRRPIYRSSLKTAGAYGEAIRPLLNALGSTGAR